MLPSKLLICLALYLFSGSHAGEVADEKTTEAVVKAVVQAENKPQSSATNHNEAKKKEEAEAVAKATTEVLVSESQVAEEVAPEVIHEAATKAKSTFKEMKNGGVNSKAAAAAAAEVEVATLDGASGFNLPKEAKDNAEKAAVAAGKAVADHPNNQAQALAEAVTKVKKEENTSGKVDLKPKVQGMVATAKAAVSSLPQLAEGAVAHGAEHVENNSQAFGAFAIVAALIGLFVIGKKAHAAHFEDSDYMKKLALIREEFNEQGDKKDLETQYSDFQEFSEMRR